MLAANLVTSVIKIRAERNKVKSNEIEIQDKLVDSP
jgi:hypothetical protein